MSRFDNKTCAICHKPLSAESDVVVCPVCGAPHHRACYLAQNRCGAEEYHSSGYEWHGYLPWEEQAAVNEPGSTAGNAQNTADTDEFTREHSAQYPGGQNAQQPFNETIDLEELLNRLNRQTMDETRGEDGVSSRELSCFVGRSVMHYSQAFAAFRAPTLPGQRKRRIFFNLCSGLFLPYHQFYRRMDAMGIGLVLLNLLSAVPTVLYYMGMMTVTALKTSQMLISVLNFIATVALCMFGDYLYYLFAVSRIKKIRARFDDGRAEGYYEALAENGTPSWLRTIIAVLAVSLVQTSITLFAGQFFTAQ